MRAPALETLHVESIEVRGDRRSTRPNKVDAIAQSMDTIGLKTPISVRYYAERPDFAQPGATDDALILIAGHHRLLGAKQLGWEKIECFVHYEGDEIDAELWEIDENLCRSELTEAEEARCLAKRKELWEAREKREADAAAQVGKVFPPVKPRGHAQPKGFAAETAEVTGQSKRSINSKVERAEKIDPDVLDAITGGKWDKGVVLDILKKLTHAEQRQALARVQSGSSPSFADAYDFIRGEDAAPKSKPVPKPAAPLNDIETMDKWLSSGMAWWNRGSKEWREEFLARIDSPVMDGGYPPLVPEQKATPGNIAEPAPRQEQAGTDTSLDRPTRVDGTARPATAAKEAAGTHPDNDEGIPDFLWRGPPRVHATEQGRG